MSLTDTAKALVGLKSERRRAREEAEDRQLEDFLAAIGSIKSGRSSLLAPLPAGTSTTTLPAQSAAQPAAQSAAQPSQSALPEPTDEYVYLPARTQ